MSAAERSTLEAGLRWGDAFVLRRCQILLASARGTHVPAIASQVGCNRQTVRTAIHALGTTGLAALTQASSRPHTRHAAFAAVAAERVRDLLHRSPREFGKPTRLWTLEVAAAVRCAEGLTPTRVTGETIRATLRRLAVRWHRATQWITSPDPAYLRNKGGATA